MLKKVKYCGNRAFTTKSIRYLRSLAKLQDNLFKRRFEIMFPNIHEDNF